MEELVPFQESLPQFLWRDDDRFEWMPSKHRRHEPSDIEEPTVKRLGRVFDNQEVHIAVVCWAAVGIRTKQDDLGGAIGVA